MVEELKCPKCGNKDKIFKCGLRVNMHKNTQRYGCGFCGTKFSLNKYSIFPTEIIQQCLSLYTLGYPCSKIGLIIWRETRVKVSRTTIEHWVRNAGLINKDKIELGVLITLTYSRKMGVRKLLVLENSIVDMVEGEALDKKVT